MYFGHNNFPVLYCLITRSRQQSWSWLDGWEAPIPPDWLRQSWASKYICHSIVSCLWLWLIMDIFQRYYQSINLLLTFFTLKTAADEDILFCKITNTQFCPSPGEYNASKVLQYSILILCIFCHILPSFCPNNGHWE